MSLVSSRVNLRHRCTLERNESAGVGEDGWENTPVWQPHLADLPCLSWAAGGRETVTGKESIVALDDVMLILPLGTDVTADDRVSFVSYRGDTLLTGPFGIRAINLRRDHIELTLMRVT